MRTIVVGLGDSGSPGALSWAARIAAGEGARLVVVHAYVPEPAVPELGWRPDPDERLWRYDQVERWCEPLRGGIVRYRTDVLPGPAAAVLERVVRRDQADLLVVGRGRPRRRFTKPLGSALAATCPCPVAVVPLGQRDHAKAGMTSWP